MVWPTAEPTATPAAVVAICAIRPGCCGAGLATAEAGAAAGTGARAAGAGDAALIAGARLQGQKEKAQIITPSSQQAEAARLQGPCAAFPRYVLHTRKHQYSGKGLMHGRIKLTSFFLAFKAQPHQRTPKNCMCFREITCNLPG